MKRVLIAVILALSALLAATGIGLGVIHITDFPYSADIGYLKISENTGLSRDEILANYNAVMDYHTPFSNVEFKLPTLKFSETGAGHFVDTKLAFTVVYIAAFAGLCIIALLFILRAADKQTLKYAGILTLAIPLAFALILAINFDAAFTLFHRLFFAGDTWIFDPSIDEIISILPAEFFMHCALVIAFFWLLASGGFFLGAKSKRHAP